jgi:hypothetical protein
MRKQTPREMVDSLREEIPACESPEEAEALRWATNALEGLGQFLNVPDFPRQANWVSLRYRWVTGRSQ